jgi:hypothetical protein
MKHVAVVLLAIFSLLTLSACIKARVVAFDNKQNTVTVQGGKRTPAEEFQQAAEEHCQGPATLLTMQETTVGYDTSAGTVTPMRRYNKMFICDSGTPDWFSLGPIGSDEDTVYADAARVHRKGDQVEMWVLYDHKVAKRGVRNIPPFLSQEHLMQFDCTDVRARLLRVMWFSGNMGQGTVLADTSKDTSRKYPWEEKSPPGTVGRLLDELACKK